jgi:hypothetical protein
MSGTDLFGLVNKTDFGYLNNSGAEESVGHWTRLFCQGAVVTILPNLLLQTFFSN